MLLLLIYSLDNPEKRKVGGCNLHFLRIAHYGKYCARFELMSRPQYLADLPALTEP
jgi:hypothetical protein